MKILILGAGKVGGTLAENLAKESFDITLIDSNAKVLEELRDKHSVYIVGSGRINVAGMTTNNMDALCSAIAEVLG